MIRRRLTGLSTAALLPSAALLLATAACGPPADDAEEAGGSELTAEAGAASAATSGEWVEIPQGERSVRTWIARPAGDGPAPAILVIHQNRGINDWVRSVADRLAAEGYIAAAPDLLSGMAPGGGDTDGFADSDAAREGIYALPPDQVTADLDAVADYLVALPRSDGSVSVSGFCWGGSQSFRFASNRPDLEAAYVFYGTAPEGPMAVARIEAPIYGFYGGADERVSATIEPTAALMSTPGQTYEPVVYDGAGHGFMSSEESAADDPNRAAMEAGWARWRELLARHAG